MSFNDLPHELLTMIFKYLAPDFDTHGEHSRGELEPLFSVNRAFRAAATPLRLRRVCISAQTSLNPVVQLAAFERGYSVSTGQIRNPYSFTFFRPRAIRLLELHGFSSRTSSVRLDEQYVQSIMHFASRCQGVTALRLVSYFQQDDHADWAAVCRAILASIHFRHLRELEVDTRNSLEQLENALASLNRAGTANSILQKNLAGITRLEIMSGLASIDALASHMQRIEILTLEDFTLSFSRREHQMVQPFGSHIIEMNLFMVVAHFYDLAALIQSSSSTLQVLHVDVLRLRRGSGQHLLQILAENFPALIDVDFEQILDRQWHYSTDARSGGARGEHDALTHCSRGLRWMQKLAENVDMHRRKRGLPLQFTMFLELPCGCTESPPTNMRWLRRMRWLKRMQ